LLFLLVLLFTGVFPEYLATNWILHMTPSSSFSAHYTLLGLFAENTALWLILLVAIPSIFHSRRTKTELKLITGLSLILICTNFLMKTPYKQFFLLPMSLLCITAGYFSTALGTRYKFNIVRKSRIILLIVFIPFIILASMIFISNHSQLEKIDYVLKNSKNSDYVYDGNIDFNIFRKDVHYFWYRLKKNADFNAYNKITGNRFSDYNIYDLILKKKPKIISDFQFQLNKYNLNKIYRKTEFKGLYKRSESE
jgi:hypothetical protein